MTTTALAEQPKPTCKQVLEACDKTIDAKNKALELSDLGIKTCKEHTAELSAEVNSLRDSNASLLRNPILWFLAGSVATTATYLLLRK